MFKGYTKQEVFDYAQKNHIQVFIISDNEIVLVGGYMNEYFHCESIYFDENNIVKELRK